ncbi:MAG: hypothetical protein KDK07_23585 [Bauldia sp.]|nr:hypothetical protein [Bauldia sp.]
MTRRALALVAAATIGLAVAGARAADRGRSIPEGPPAGSIPGGWTVVIAPYVWATGLAGDVGADGTIVHVDQSFGDIVADLDFGFLGMTEVRHDRFAVFSDFVYGKLSTTEDSPFPAYVDSVATKTTTVMWTGAATYRLVDAARASLDVAAGFRLVSLANQLDLKGGSLDGRGGEQSVSWTDPIVGVMGDIDLSRRLYLTGWAMVGGFGVSSDSLWDVMGAAGYRFDDTVSMMLGYRAAAVDFENDSLTYDVSMRGLIAGVVLRY